MMIFKVISRFFVSPGGGTALSTINSCTNNPQLVQDTYNQVILKQALIVVVPSHFKHRSQQTVNLQDFGINADSTLTLCWRTTCVQVRVDARGNGTLIKRRLHSVSASSVQKLWTQRANKRLFPANHWRASTESNVPKNQSNAYSYAIQNWSRGVVLNFRMQIMYGLTAAKAAKNPLTNLPDVVFACLKWVSIDWGFISSRHANFKIDSAAAQLCDMDV